MALRRLSDPLRIPPPGAVTIAVARHITPVYPDPRMLDLHRQRSVAIHELVDSCGLEVSDWGGTDAAHPSEIVEIVVPIATAAIGAAATFLAAWVSTRSARRKQLQESDVPVLGFAVQAHDGTRVEFTYRVKSEFDYAVGSIAAVMEAAARARPPDARHLPGEAAAPEG